MISDARRTARNALYRPAVLATWFGLGINLLLGLTKLVGGLLGDSFALLTDAFNSLGDVFTSAAILYAFHVAQRPPDEEHPYGHTRAEAIAGISVAVLLAASALFLGLEAIGRFSQPHALPPWWTLGIAASNVLIKEALYQYKIRLGRKTGSSALIANAWDHRADAFSALAVLTGLLVVRWAGPDYIFADEIAALAVVAAILWSAGKLYRDSAHELLDAQADPSLVEAVRRTAGAVDGVRAVEKLWVRKTGLEYLVDIHIEVDAALSVARGHEISHAVKARLLGQHPTLLDVLVHLEPFPHEQMPGE